MFPIIGANLVQTGHPCALHEVGQRIFWLTITDSVHLIVCEKHTSNYDSNTQHAHTRQCSMVCMMTDHELAKIEHP